MIHSMKLPDSRLDMRCKYEWIDATNDDAQDRDHVMMMLMIITCKLRSCSEVICCETIWFSWRSAPAIGEPSNIWAAQPHRMKTWKINWSILNWDCVLLIFQSLNNLQRWGSFLTQWCLATALWVGLWRILYSICSTNQPPHSPPQALTSNCPSSFLSYTSKITRMICLM